MRTDPSSLTATMRRPSGLYAIDETQPASRAPTASSPECASQIRSPSLPPDAMKAPSGL